MQAFLRDLFRGQAYDDRSFFLIAGPCVVEGASLLDEVADTVSGICRDLGIPYVFKSSYRKANRTSADSFTGLGDAEALRMLSALRARTGLPVTTDIHAAGEAGQAAEHVDILQIPAFLCRQTDLLQASAATGRIVNVKKGQFLSGAAMRFAADKVRAAGNDKVILTERGNSFGYHDLVVDFRNIPEMQATGAPVVMDCTHSLQQPNQATGVTGGQPAMIGTMARAAIAAGADGIFIETHPDPARARSDGANMLPLHRMRETLEVLVRLRQALPA
jgi:2-dehydro-3-deoxyphosphooctonate aldolase (KDO 8-P synthase)